mmetsp:Transcript_95484/g.273883  ORF Transcript_95484/g.273883 Transcript_95484/m.273883 type:complete len:259 (-) Transcript_95484:8-784(-)
MASGGAEDEDLDEFGDPEPAIAPPAWAADLIADARARVGLEVYPPSDDTFLLLEALAADAVHLRALRPSLCIEIGCGSGAVSAGLLEVLQGRASSELPAGELFVPLILAIDKNPSAVASAAGLLRAREANRADCIRASLTGALRVRGTAEVVVCNPPYVPGEKEEMDGCGISVSWAGGDRGREVIDVLLPKAAELLAPGGLFYLVCLAENEPEEIIEVMRGLGLRASVAKRETRGMEDLLILRFQRPGGPAAAAVRIP